MRNTIRMQRTLWCAFLTALAVFPLPQPAFADASPRWTDAQLAGFAAVILRGRVTRIASARDDRNGGLYTYVSLDVTDVLKGSIPDTHVVLKQLGGRVGSSELRVAGQPTFTIGKDVVLFLEVRPRDRTLTTTAAWQGAFTIVHRSDGDLAVREDPGGAARGVLGDRTRPLDAWLRQLRRQIGEMNAPPQAAIDLLPIDAPAATDLGPMSRAGWRAATPMRVDAIAPGQPGLAGGGEQQLRRAADFWTSTGIATLLSGGLQPPGGFLSREPDGRIAVGLDDCDELSPDGGTIATSGAWIKDDGDDAAPNARFLGAGVITNRGAPMTRLLARGTCFEQVVTHELGHSLGLADSPDGGGIMAPSLQCDAGFGRAEPAGAARPTFVPLDPKSADAITCALGCNIIAAAAISVPNAPSNLTHTLSGSTLTLTWTAPSSGQAPTEYVIEAGSAPGGTDVANFSTGSAATSFSAAVGGNAIFYIRVRARNYFGTSEAPSNEITVVVGSPTQPPGAPAALSASVAGSDVTLTWSAPTSGGTVSTYIIQAGSTPDASNLANFSTGSTATSFFAGGVGAGTYFVRVRASNASGISAPSNEVLLLVGSGCSTPGAPTKLEAFVSGSTVTLGWTAGAGASSYRLQVGSSPGQTNLLDTDLASTATTLLATNVGAGTYFVRVRSTTACAQSGPSNEVVVIVQ